MFSSKSTEQLAFVSRQLSQLLERSPLPAALQTLSDASPNHYSRDIEYLRRLLEGSAERRPGKDPYHAIQKLLPAVGNSRDTLFREFVAYVRQSRIVFETYSAGVVSLVGYLAAIASVAFVVAMIFAIYVIPTFEEMFAEHRANLPEFTQLVFALGGAGVPVFASLLALTVIAVVLFVRLFHQRIQQMKPLPRWPRWAPMLGRIAETYNFGLFLNYARILGSCGVEPDRAVAEAAALTNQPDTLSLDGLRNKASSREQLPALTELSVATRLGHFDAEVSHQCEQHVGELTLALVETRDRVSAVLKVALYVFVGGLVVAMYLPIFRMGSVI